MLKVIQITHAVVTLQVVVFEIMASTVPYVSDRCIHVVFVISWSPSLYSMHGGRLGSAGIIGIIGFGTLLE